MKCALCVLDALESRVFLSSTPGIQATYFDNANFTGATVQRVDSAVDFNWGRGSPAAAIATDTFSARWEGKLTVPTTGAYTLFTVADDGVRLYVDGVLRIDNWRDQSATQKSFSANLVAGQVLDLKMEYYENGFDAVARLLWQGPNLSKRVITNEYLSTPESTPEPPPQNPSSKTRINFQPSGAAIPTGFLADLGQPFGNRGNGLSYGWNTNISSAARDRNSTRSPDQAYDTLNHMQKSGNAMWEIGLPNGTYTVRIVAGDPNHADSIYHINVENTLAVSGTPNSTTRWFEGTQTVQVDDGRLTISNGTGAQNNKICFVEIIPQTSQPVPTPGSGTGLSATYYDNSNFTGNSIQRIDARVDFDWGNGSPATAVAGDTFSIRWAGHIEATHTDTYRFYTYTDDGVRLWVDGNLLIDQFKNQSPTEHSATIALQAGKKYNIRIDYFENSGGALAKLSWSNASIPKQVVPSSRLYPALSSDNVALTHAVEFADEQLRRTIQSLAGATDVYVNFTKPDGAWNRTTADAWESGFLPAQMWQLYALTGDAYWKDQATAWTLGLADQKTRTSDVVFAIYNTFGPLYAATGDSAYRQLMLDTAASKNGAFNDVVGAFPGWNRASTSGNPDATWGTYIDLMMDVELLFWAGKQIGNSMYIERAITHSETIQQYFVRSDGGSAQWGYFNRATGEFVGNETYQGYANDSTWARGQAWGLYGFTVTYRETGRSDFLATAKKMADFIIANAPADGVPFWDYDDPAIPNTYRDTSAAAIAASGLLELSRLLSNTADATKYFDFAAKILNSLATGYLAEGTNNAGILLHGAGFVAAGNSDSALTMGDYYFLEAARRYLND